MRRRDRGLAAALLLAAATAAADEPAFRHNASIAIEQPAPFVQLPLDAGVYARSEQAGLQDLRVVDARGERVPFALLAPRADRSDSVEEPRAATLYALPRKPADGSAWPLPVEVLVQGDAIRVVKRAADARGRDTATPEASPGWLVDTGERGKDEPPVARRALRLAWSGPAEFSVGVDVEASADLRSWRRVGGSQLLALNSPAGPLTQPKIPLPADAPRFVRLVWLDAAAAPRLTGATLVLERQQNVVLDAPTTLEFTASAEPAGKAPPEPAAKRGLHVDLGGPLPLASVDLKFAAGGSRVVPLRVQGRLRIDEPWRELAQAVVYRLERGGTASASPAVELHATARYLRLLPDERAAPLDAAATRVVVQARLARLVFARQGQAPYALLAGDARAPAGALAPATLVPALDEERPRFGRASLGAWQEVEAVARRAESERRMAALRPYALWGVLLAGVAALGVMVWRLARSKPQG